MHGRITRDGHDVSGMPSNRRLQEAGVAYLLQDNSVFPDMTVEENLWMGGYLLARPDEARKRAEAVLARYESLRKRRTQRAGALSGGERRLLEDRKSTRLNSSHLGISYAVFCLKKKNQRSN